MTRTHDDESTLHTRSQFFGRLFAGYHKIFLGGLRLTAAALFLLLVSALISVPIWFFAHSAAEAFDFVVIGAIAIVIGWTITRRVQSKDKKWSFRRFAISTSLIAFPTVLLLLAVVARSGILALTGFLLLSGVIAWRVVPS